MEQATNGNLALMKREPQQPTLAQWDTDENLALLRQTYAKDLSNAEFSLYVEHCRQLRLNPLTKQVQPIKFDGKTLSFHTTIHGLIAIAARSGTYAGMDDVKFDLTPKGDTLNGQHPHSATVTAYKLVGGQRCAITATVYWVERNRNQASWKVQPFAMLAKCARAEVLRLGWEETLGMYIEEEIPYEQAVDSKPVQTKPAPIPAGQEPPFAPPAGKTWMTWCADLAKQLGIFDTKDDYLAFVKEVCGKLPPESDKANWQKFAHQLLTMIDEANGEGIKEEDEGLAKMAGLGEGEADASE